MTNLDNKISIAKQKSLLQTAKNENIKLADLLDSENLCYDDLRYIDNPALPGSCLEPFETLDLKKKMEYGIPAVSFFSGAGGFDIGFDQAGFENLVSVEIDRLCCDTLRLNNPNKTIIGPPISSGDIRNREEIASMLRRCGIEKGFQGVFHGGPPCQSFSIAANQRFGKDDGNFKRKGFDDPEKGTLIFDYLWQIKEFQPSAFIIENVSGILDCDTDGRIKAALDDLCRLGYSITPPAVVNAADYGVPQNRLRWFVLGTKGKKPLAMPQPEPRTTVCGSVFLRSLEGVQNHETRKHSANSVSRYMLLPYGRRDSLGRVDRLDPRVPSKTVIAGGTKGGGRSHLHPFIPRTLSVRECARLQTFPDDYVFTGSTARQFTQVGNAVPPILAYKLALAIKDNLTKGSVSLATHQAV